MCIHLTKALQETGCCPLGCVYVLTVVLIKVQKTNKAIYMQLQVAVLCRYYVVWLYERYED